jgi:hypothetical protein
LLGKGIGILCANRAAGVEQKAVFIFTFGFARGFCEEQRLLAAKPFSD